MNITRITNAFTGYDAIIKTDSIPHAFGCIVAIIGVSELSILPVS